MEGMKPLDARRRSRPRRPLPAPGRSTGPRTLLCVDLRAVETAWSQRPIQEIRGASRGGRLGWMLSGMDLDPLRTLERNARTLLPLRAQQVYDALCEELAESVLHDVPEAIYGALLPLVAPHGSGECPYPAPAGTGGGGAAGAGGLAGPVGALGALIGAGAPWPAQGAAAAPGEGGLVIVADGRLPAEAAALALAGAVYPPDGEVIDAALWSDVLAAVLPMLEAVRDRGRSLLIEA